MTLTGWKIIDRVMIAIILGTGVYLIGFYAGYWPLIGSENITSLLVVTLALLRLFVEKKIKIPSQSSTET